MLVLLLLGQATMASAAKLDVEARDLNSQDVKDFGGKIHSGAYISKATGNALAAGLRDGDVIVAVSDEKVHGIADLEIVLKEIRGRQMDVAIERVGGEGLVRPESHTYKVEMAIDLQIQKAFVLDLGQPSPVAIGRYGSQAMLLWHANKVWVYDKKIDREHFVSLLKVYNMAEHKTYRFIVPETVLYSTFLNDHGLLAYVSSNEHFGQIGIVDMQQQVRWQYEIAAVEAGRFGIAMHDSNSDQVPEIFACVGTDVFCLDGATGNKLWQRTDLAVYLDHQRKREDPDYRKIFVDDFNHDGVFELCVGPKLINAATGEKGETLTFDPAREQGGLVECVQLVGDAMPDIVTRNGLLDGNSAERIWEPLRSLEYILADMDGDGVPEITYLLGDQKLHVHEIRGHRELYSFAVSGTENLRMEDLNNDGFADILICSGETATLYQSNIPVPEGGFPKASLSYAGPLLDYGMRKDKFFFFARDMYRQGKVRESLPLFLRALAENPGRQDVVQYLAAGYVRERDYEGALSLLRTEGNEDFAREQLEKFSGEIVAYLLDKGDTIQAIRFLEAAKKQDSLLLSRCYLAIGKPEVAIELVMQLTERPPEAQLILGRSYVLTGEMIKARIALENYLKVFPASVEGWEELGELEVHEKNWDRALSAFDKVLQLESVAGHISLSHFYVRDSEFRDLIKSEGHAKMAYRQEVSDRTRLQLAHVLVEMEAYLEAHELLDRIIDPGRSLARYEQLKNRCVYQLQAREKLSEAEKCLVSPVFKARNMQQAEALLLEVVSNYPQSTVVHEVHFRLGEMYLMEDLRDEEKARFYFEKAGAGGGELAPRAHDRLQTLGVKPEPANKRQENGDSMPVELEARKPEFKKSEPEPDVKKTLWQRLFNKSTSQPSPESEVMPEQDGPSVPFPQLKMPEGPASSSATPEGEAFSLSPVTSG